MDVSLLNYDLFNDAASNLDYIASIGMVSSA
jgi:hypothetical protein